MDQRIWGAAARAITRALDVPMLDLPTWADNYRKLTRKSSAIEGDWKTARVEVARGPMLATTEPGVEIITLMVSTQLMKTELLLNTIGRMAHTDPCPILVVYPNGDGAEAFSKERLAPMIAATPVLRDRFAPPFSRKAGNTIEVKHFTGGFVACVSAASPMDLAARPVRVVLLDEIDKYTGTKEGDPIALAEERASTFHNRLIIRACSPTTEETSRVYHSYLNSDQRRPYVQCPHCKMWQYLEFFRHVHWSKQGGQHEPESALIYCSACNEAWSERQRRTALNDIRWLQTRTYVCCGEGQDPRQVRKWDYDPVRRVGYALCPKCGKRAVSNAHVGYTASKLYSPFLTIPQLAAKWLEAEKDIESKQTFYNTQLALPYKIEASKEIRSQTLSSRRELWDAIPDGIVVVTAGVDVQPTSQADIGRLEIEVVGWSETEESWSLAYEVLSGDPARPEVWAKLDDLLLHSLTREDGRKMRILGTCIDSGGHNTEEVYKFCLARRGRNVWAIKGASDRGGQWSPVWPAHARRRPKWQPGGYRPVMIGVNAAKEAIRQRLLITEPGPGYCHFPAGRPASYFDQLTSERLIVERKGGYMVRRWELQARDRANEALDVRVYAYAALQGLINDRGFKPARVAAMLAELPAEPEPMNVAEPAAEPPKPPPPVAVPQQQRIVPPAVMHRRMMVAARRGVYMARR